MQAAENALALSRPPPGRILRALGRLPRWHLGILVLFVLILFLAVVGGSIAPYSPTEPNLAIRLQPPSAEHWMGTDDNGFDVFSRILAAPHIDVTIALIATAIAVLIGAPIGVALAMLESARGLAARSSAEISMRFLEVIQAFPVFVFAMVLVAVFGGSTVNIIAAVALVNAPVFVRLVRSEVASLLRAPYVDAARASGNSEVSTGLRHLLPNVIPTILVQVSVTVGFAIMLTAGLSFIGAGVRPPAPELGSMIAVGSRYMITGQWWPVLFPSIALGLIVFVFAIMGEIATTLLEPRADRTSAPAAAATDAEPRAVAGSAAAPVAAKGEAPILAVENLSVGVVGRPDEPPVLSDIGFSLGARERIAVVGESGSGKSVLLRALLRLLPAELEMRSGRIAFLGRDLMTMDAEALRKSRLISLSAVLANPKSQLHPLFTVGEMMASAVTAHEPASRAEIRARSVDLLRKVGIGDAERRLAAYPHELSGGMAQRVCLAIALMYKPRLIIADEPTAGLDVTIQRQVLDLIQDLAREADTAQVIITSDLGIAAHYCDRIIVLRRGRVVEENTVAEFFRAPKHAYSRMLVTSSQTAL